MSTQPADTTGIRRSADLFTVSAIGVAVYVVTLLAHEGLGHAMVALALGAHVDRITSYVVDCQCAVLGSPRTRLVAGAGIVVNTLLAGLAFAATRVLPRPAPATRYALWLFAHVNGLVAAGYLLALSFAPLGDVNAVVRGLPAEAVWRSVLTLGGLGAVVALRRHAARTITPLLGADPSRARVRELTLTPYLLGGGVIVAAALLHDRANDIAVFSAVASTFGGTLPLALVSGHRPAAPVVGDVVQRSLAWCAAGFLALVVQFVVVGGGIAP